MKINDDDDDPMMLLLLMMMMMNWREVLGLMIDVTVRRPLVGVPHSRQFHALFGRADPRITATQSRVLPRSVLDFSFSHAVSGALHSSRI